MTETCVVTIFKSNPDIAVMPQDINLITCYDQLTLKPEIGEAQAKGIIKDKFFREICLPGMTEDFRLPVLFKYHTYGEGDATKSFTGIKVVFVCEEKNEQIEEQLSVMADMVFEELAKEKLVAFLRQAESSMYKKFQLPDTRCVLIANHSLDQFTHYNMPCAYRKANEE
jgi:hypothetical protein